MVETVTPPLIAMNSSPATVTEVAVATALHLFSTNVGLMLFEKAILMKVNDNAKLSAMIAIGARISSIIVALASDAAGEDMK